MCLALRYLATDRLGVGEHAGFEWNVVHNRMGHRCGYVRVLPGHPWFGKRTTAIEAFAHGDWPLNFARAGRACPTHGADAEWWVGFDCAHFSDAPDLSLPVDLRVLPAGRGAVVRSQAYVEAECRSLCEQAAAAVAR